jgi:putative addiction module component (TIGR02574 family)
MATKEFNRLTSTALALPSRQRAQLAQALWNSIDNPMKHSPVDKRLMAQLKRRDREISQGKVRCTTHEEVMKAAYRAIGCSR